MNKTLKNLSIDDMLKEIKRRNRLIAKLNRSRATLLAKVAEIDEAIKANGGEIKNMGKTRKAPAGVRQRNQEALPDVIASVLSKETPLNASQIEEAVIAKGYRSSSTAFKTIIFQALAKDKRFKKAARGQYVLK